MSIIVVEGVDASGKSTLLENARLEIKKKYFVLLRHSQRPYTPHDVMDFLDLIENTILPNLVVDRHPLISEPIYGPILRGENLVAGFEDKDSATKRLKHTIERIIYCRPPAYQIKENLHRLPQLKGVKENIQNLIEAYDQRMVELEKAGMKVFHYDYTDPDVSLVDLFFGDPK